MSDVHLDGTDAPGTAADGSRLVHVDCERCGSRLEVRVPLAFQLAGREATVRCGACETLLQVSVPPPSPQRGAPSSPADSHACLLYTPDAADEEDSEECFGRRFNKKLPISYTHLSLLTNT